MDNADHMDHQDTPIDISGAESARLALALVDEQRRQTAERLFPSPAPILAVWGFAYLVGFGALWLSSRSTGAFAAWGSALLLAGLGILASVVTVARMTRIGRGVKGPSRRSALMFSWCWPAVLVSVSAFDIGLSRHGIPQATLSLLWPGSFLLVVAVLFLAAGVLFDDRAQFGLGLWSLVVAASSTLAGRPGNFAVFALAGGGGLLVTSSIRFLADHAALFRSGQ